jgi:hypothetical protein
VKDENASDSDKTTNDKTDKSKEGDEKAAN